MATIKITIKLFIGMIIFLANKKCNNKECQDRTTEFQFKITKCQNRTECHFKITDNSKDNMI